MGEEELPPTTEPGEGPPKPEPNAQKLKRLCRAYGVQSEQDALWMDEFTLPNGLRVDCMTIDLHNLMLRGYEVKVSRSDFFGDDKWHLYLHYFNYFSFVVPRGMLTEAEIKAVPKEIYVLEWDAEKPRYWSLYSEWVERLSLKKRGRRLQPKFVRETYGEHFFHGLILKYVRDLRYRASRMEGHCPKCDSKFLCAAEQGEL